LYAYLSSGENINKIRGRYGLYAAGEPCYAPLLKFESIQVFRDKFPPRLQSVNLYRLAWFFKHTETSPDEFLSLPENVIRRKLVRACQLKKGGSAAQVMFYSVAKFLRLNQRKIVFDRDDKRDLFKVHPVKNAKQHIPERDEVYRMVDSYPFRRTLQHLRGKALILCQWQSGVRSSCLCSWRYGMFRDRLSGLNAPLTVKVVAERTNGMVDVAEDTKLSSYGLGYYYTFIQKEAVETLKTYLDERKRQGWEPNDEDFVFVTEGTNTRGKPLKSYHVLDVVKTASEKIGLDPSTVWSHLLRKSFRKMLRKAGLEDDVCESLMGHRLAGSRSAYFDPSDVDQARKEYKRAATFFSRLDTKTIEALENEIPKRDLQVQDLTKTVEDLTKKYAETVVLLSKVMNQVGIQNSSNTTDEEKADELFGRGAWTRRETRTKKP